MGDELGPLVGTRRRAFRRCRMRFGAEDAAARAWEHIDMEAITRWGGEKD